MIYNVDIIGTLENNRNIYKIPYESTDSFGYNLKVPQRCRFLYSRIICTK